LVFIAGALVLVFAFVLSVGEWWWWWWVVVGVGVISGFA
jgi:hypothetical protein